MVTTIERTLSKDGKFPLTLIVLDEVQQFIGADNQRALDIQEAVESCSKSFGGKLLFVGTGQTGISGTKDLKKIEGRFTLRVELSDADVDYVIRKVILAKKPAAAAPLAQVLQKNRGEISRHLDGTALQHTLEDDNVFAQDYPLLPTRRKLWEKFLRVVDLTGTDSQLRNQLSLTHNVIKTNLNKPLGNVIGADYIYFATATSLLQNGILPRNIYDPSLEWYKKENPEDTRLLARACGLVFMLNKLKANEDLKIRVDVDTLADLLLEDLESGSSALRAKLPPLLDNCELLITVDNGAGQKEYRIQTPESGAWRDDFKARMSSLSNSSRIISDTREERLQDFFRTAAGKLQIWHGNSNVTREAHIIFNSPLPADSARKIHVSVVDGWSGSESALKSEAAQAGLQASAIFVFLPKRHEDQLRENIIKSIAAEQTLNGKGTPDSPEGREARAYIENIKYNADAVIGQALAQITGDSVVFQAGGQQVQGDNLKDALNAAMENSLARLYPDFAVADSAAWGKAYEKASKGAPDALKALGYNDEVANNPVCKAVLGFIGSGKTGSEIRGQFESAPYGWSKDAIEGALLVLLVAGLARAADERGNAIEPVALNRQKLGKYMFRVQAVSINAAQRLAIRKLYNQAGIDCKTGDEAFSAGKFLDKMLALAEAAGGSAPKPAMPSSSLPESLGRESGNEQLKAIYDAREELEASWQNWSERVEKIASRWPEWQQLEELARFAKASPAAAPLLLQIEEIRSNRQLLADPDPLQPLLSALEQLLREKLNELQKAYQDGHEAGMEQLGQDDNWNRLKPEQKDVLLAENRLNDAFRPQIAVGNAAEIQASLKRHSLHGLESEIAALPKRFSDAARGAAKINAPDTQYVYLPRRTLASEADIAAWLTEAEKLLRDALRNGPVMAK